MDESMKCECGNDTFWYFGTFVRCPKCYQEYKRTETVVRSVEVEHWTRRWSVDGENAHGNWEHSNAEQLKNII